MQTNYTLIAELGCNHQGNINLAKEMILAAKKAGCFIIKLQKRTPKLQFSPEKYYAPHPCPENAFGKTYGEHRENLELNVAQHSELKKFAEDNGVEYSSSVFDIVSTKEILSINPSHIKIPSTVNNNSEIIELIAKNFDNTIHVSLGMTTRAEEKNLVEILEKYGKLKNTVLYHCVSSYPTEAKDVCLLEIERLKNLYGQKIKAVGLSGHHKGNLSDCAALVLGAEYLERHFTFDKNAKGSDHKISLDYAEMAELNNKLNETQKYLTYKPQEILECEKQTRYFHKDNSHLIKNGGAE